MKKLELLWSDEFDGQSGEAINSDFWNFDLGDGSASGIPGWGNQEREWYRPEQAVLDGAGHLVISAERAEPASAPRAYYNKPAEWYSSKITTKNKVEVKYGLVTARVKIPRGAGTWPAFWMLGNDLDTSTWPQCGEIDILEVRGRDTSNLVATLHGPGYFGEHGCGNEWVAPVAMDEGFHDFGVEWLPDRISWLFDGEVYSVKTRDDVAPNEWVFDHPFYIIANLAIGGNFTGDIDPDLVSAELVIDHIRVYSVDGVGEVFLNG